MSPDPLFDVGREIAVVTGVAGQLGGQYARALSSPAARASPAST